MTDSIALICNEYKIKCKHMINRNQQVNTKVGRAHQTIGNLLCIFNISTIKLDQDNPWGGILSAVIFALWSTIHTTHKATSMQLVFGRDAMQSITHLVNWHYIQDHPQKIIKKNNKWKNVKWKLHKYHINDKVMIKNNQKLKYRTNMHSRPYQITKGQDNCTVPVES
eukprot:15358890-Ditylum_brightwellii.AAC.1